jgi:Ubiquitin-associated protein 2
MPGDATTASTLDVQFGGLEFGSDSNSFEFAKNASEPTSKYKTSSDLKQGGGGPPLDLSSMNISKSQQAQDSMSAYSAGGQSSQTANAKDLSQASLSAAISHSQKLGGTDSMTFPAQVNDHKSQQQQSGSYRPPVSSSGIDSGKPDPSSMAYSTSSNTSSNYQTSYQKAYQSGSNYPQGGSGGYSSQGSSASQYQSNPSQSQSYSSSSQSGYGTQSSSFPSSATATTTYSQTSNPTTYHQGNSNYQSYPSIGQQVSVSSSNYNQQYPQSYITSGSGNAYTAASTQYPGSYGSNGPTTTTSSLHGSSSVGGSKMGSSISSSKDGQVIGF